MFTVLRNDIGDIENGSLGGKISTTVPDYGFTTLPIKELGRMISLWDFSVVSCGKIVQLTDADNGLGVEAK